MHGLTGAIIPALMHGIPSELHSETCLGESSMMMGDLLGSPRVAPLLFASSPTRPALSFFFWSPAPLPFISSHFLTRTASLLPMGGAQ